MSYLIFIDLVARTVSIVLAVYFIFILLSGDSKYKRHSFVLVVYSAIYFFMPELDQTSLTYRESYTQDVNVSMLIEVAAGLAMVCLLPFDRLAKFHSLILAFAVICHCMVYCNLKVDPEWIQTIASGFYTFYDELIILVGLMQMAVSYNGIITVYNNGVRKLQSFNNWRYNCTNYLRTCLSARKKREIKARGKV